MFKHTISELKEAMVCLEAGQVTLKYPFVPHPPDENFRGKVELNTALCIGCGACANACPAHLIRIDDKVDQRVLSFDLSRCTYCAACRDACPQKAIALTPQFELSTAAKNDLHIQFTLHLINCRECGAIVDTQRALDLIRDQLGSEYGSMDWIDLCSPCRRRDALKNPALYLEVTA